MPSSCARKAGNTHKTVRFPILFFASFLLFCIASRAQSSDANVSTNSSAGAKTFTFQLAAAAITSGGIYNAQGVLVRTLWAQQKYDASTHTVSWDGLDNDGKPVPAGNYSWTVLANNVKYTWQGVIGNTSDSMSGTTKHKGYQPIITMCFYGSTGYYGIGYSEALTMTYKFDTNHIQQRTAVQNIPFGMAPAIVRNCTDGNYVYWAAYDTWNAKRSSFVYATKISDDSRVVFPSGFIDSLSASGNQPRYSVISYRQDTAGISDVSVQQSGIYLFIARPKSNALFVLNKRSGAQVDSLFIPKVSYVRVDASDTHIWVTHDGTTTEKFTINPNGTLASTGISIISSQPVVGMDVNKTNSTLAILEGGTNQIIHFYNPITGESIKSVGQPGGYLNNANVNNNKFYWNDARGTYATFVSFAPNGSFWVGDFGNGRVQHFSASNRYINRIAWIPVFYNVGIDYANPSRVFADMKEYNVNWAKKMDNGNNGSWTLVKNWGGDVIASQTYNPYEGIFTPLTFPNGHTFYFAGKGANSRQLVELKSDGTKNYTGILVSSNWYLDKSNNLYSQTRTLPNQSIVWTRRMFSGTYSGNNPVWSYKIDTVQMSPVIKSFNEPGYHGDGVSYRPNCITDDAVFIAFNASTIANNNSGYHIGGIKDNVWKFKTAKANTTSYKGAFPTGEQFDIGNGVRNAGGVCIAFGKSFIWNYHGEFWRGSQTNMFTHTYSNGLVINQFGTANGATPGVRSRNCYPGDAGNALSVQVVQVKDGTTYLLHNDESIQGGIHVWKITGMNTIRLLSGKFSQ